MVTKVNPRQIAGLKELNLSVEDIKAQAAIVDDTISTLREDVDFHTNKFAVVDTDIQALKDRPIGGGGSTTVGGGSSGIDVVQLNALMKNLLEDAKSRMVTKFRSNNMVVDSFADALGLDDVIPDAGVVSSVMVAHPVMTSATTPAPYVITASSSPSDYPLKQIFDGTLAGWWQTGANGWVQLDTNVAKCITKIMITGFNWTSGSYAPRTFTFAGSNDETTWKTLFTGVNPNNGVPTSYSFENTNSYRYHRLTIHDIHGSSSYSGLSDLKLYETMLGAAFTTATETLTKPAKYLYVYPMYTGSAKFEASLDNGVNWTEIQVGTLVDTSKYVSTNKLKLRVTQYEGFSMRGLSYVWYDEDSIKSASTAYDPLMDSIMLNDTVNLIYSNFRSAEQRSVSKFAWKNFVIDTFKDTVGVDLTLSSPGISVANGEVRGAFPSLAGTPTTNNYSVNAVVRTFSTSTGAANAYAMFLDNGTELGSAQATSFWAKVDFGIPTTITDYIIQGGTDNYWSVNGFSIEGSNDDTTYTTIDTRGTNPNTWVARMSYKFSSAQTYRYYRLNVPSSSFDKGSFKISRLLFFDKRNKLGMVTTPDTTSGTPKRMVIVSEVTGPDVTYELSGDNGVTWNKVEGNKMVDISKVNFTSIRIKVLLGDDTTKLQSLGYAWFDSTTDSSAGTVIDPGTMTRIQNLETNLLKTNFRLATVQNASKYAMGSMVIEDFNDKTGFGADSTVQWDSVNKAITAYNETTPYIMTGGTVNGLVYTTPRGDVVTASGGTGIGGAFDGVSNTYGYGASSSGPISLTINFVAPIVLRRLAGTYQRPDNRTYSVRMTVTYSKDSTNGVNGTWSANQVIDYTNVFGYMNFVGAEGVKYLKVTLSDIGAWPNLSELLVFGYALDDFKSSAFISTKDTLPSVPQKIILSASETAGGTESSVTYSISRDNGVTFKEVTPDVLTDLSSLPTGKDVVMKANIVGTTRINAIGYSWQS